MTEVLRAKLDFPKRVLLQEILQKKKLRAISTCTTSCFGKCMDQKTRITSSGYASGWMAIRGAEEEEPWTDPLYCLIMQIGMDYYLQFIQQNVRM